MKVSNLDDQLIVDICSCACQCQFVDLPSEMVRKILILSNTTIKSISRVCQTWHQICSEPKLWVNYRLCIILKNVDIMVKWEVVKFLSRFVAIETSESVFREIFNHSDDIAELIIRGNGLNARLPGVNKLLLVNCVNRIKSLVIWKTRLSSEQLKRIFLYMS